MSADEFKARLDMALGDAIGRDTDLDEIEETLIDALDRVEEVRTIRGGR